MYIYVAYSIPADALSHFSICVQQRVLSQSELVTCREIYEYVRCIHVH